MVEKKLFDGEHEMNSDIMFLVQREGKTRLMSFKSCPWKPFDWDDDWTDGAREGYKHSIFLFSGILGEKEIKLTAEEIEKGKKDPIAKSIQELKLKS